MGEVTSVDRTGRTPVASRSVFQIRLALRDGFSENLAEVADELWRGNSEIIADRAMRRSGEPWKVVNLTVDLSEGRATADRRANALEQSPLVESAEVVEKTWTIWSDATFLSKGRGSSNPVLYSDLVLLFFAHDPVGINFESNTDEYEPEVRTVLPRLPSATNISDVVCILHEDSSGGSTRQRVVRNDTNA